LKIVLCGKVFNINLINIISYLNFIDVILIIAVGMFIAKYQC
jgi:hypothetical protein